MEGGTVSNITNLKKCKLILVFQGRSIVMAVWRVNTVTMTIASVSMALARMARGIRGARDTDRLAEILSKGNRNVSIQFIQLSFHNFW